MSALGKGFVLSDREIQFLMTVCVRAEPGVGWRCGTAWSQRTLERPGKQEPCGSRLSGLRCTQQKCSFSDVRSCCLYPLVASRLHKQRHKCAFV
ncbi:hypothetical protein Celaphus_00017777 [Cervus elaphus hippelaphus]|uniref:Uncharacterized protein n=1 Tax=Cervus elaphus hippelaphus TaxID=46360 RepID=A0A212C6R8_CEREH|nr:hypothetical protein Celaphus_00017777 [Cervus elaphus hippelaphus]